MTPIPSLNILFPGTEIGDAICLTTMHDAASPSFPTAERGNALPSPSDDHVSSRLSSAERFPLFPPTHTPDPLFSNMAMIRRICFSFLLIVGIPALVTALPHLKVRRTLLPYNLDVPTNYTLEIEHADGSCFRWESSRTDVATVTPDHGRESGWRSS